MMCLNFKSKFVLRCLILLIFQSRNIDSQVVDENKQTTNQNQCGGPLEGDIGSLTYPIPGQMVQPGELCVWTINLQTTKAFTFNFTNLNIDSNSECADGSVRIYSLTNLVATDKLENYTLCNENPAPGNLFLMENVAAVIFYSGSNPGLETGFTLNWEGIAFNPIPSVHFNSYSTTPSGLIKFPVEGEYEPNTIATWLVKAGQIDEEINVDFNLTSLSLETCLNVEDPCVCDALILYEITDQGVLTESERFCGEKSSAVKDKLSANFILAFFADFHPSNNTANGFEVIYKPSSNGGTTSTTTTVSPVPDVPCGTVINAVVDEEGNPFEGQLIYKPGLNYEANERCVWTLRSRSGFFNPSAMEFQLEQAEFAQDSDRVIVDLFTYGGNWTSQILDPHVGTLFLTTESVGISHGSSADVAIITFATEGSLGKGFILSYKVSEVECTQPDCYEIISTDVINSETEGTIGENSMTNFMLSTFVLAPGNFQFNSVLKRARLVIPYLEICPPPQACCDALWVYSFSYDSGLTAIDNYCGATDPDMVFGIDDLAVFVLKSDSSEESQGFTLSWELENSSL